MFQNFVESCSTPSPCLLNIFEDDKFLARNKRKNSASLSKRKLPSGAKTNSNPNCSKTIQVTKPKATNKKSTQNSDKIIKAAKSKRSKSTCTKTTEEKRIMNMLKERNRRQMMASDYQQLQQAVLAMATAAKLLKKLELMLTTGQRFEALLENRLQDRQMKKKTNECEHKLKTLQRYFSSNKENIPYNISQILSRKLMSRKTAERNVLHDHTYSTLKKLK